jgi:hypothetical protein
MEQDNASTSGGTGPSQPLHEPKQEQAQQNTAGEEYAASIPQDVQTQKHPAPGGTSANWPASTKLFLEGQDPADPAMYGENTSIVPPPPLVAPDAPTVPGAGYPTQLMPAPGTPRRPSSNKAVWLVAGIAGALAAMIVIGLLGTGLFAFSSRNNSSIPPAHVSSTPHGKVSSSSPASSTSTPVPAATTYFAAIPNHLNVRTDCQVDNGYRCTVVIVASQLMPGSASWVASSSLSSKFSPASGVVYPNQQQQVIVYVYNTCPYSGSVVFSTNGGAIAVPIVC